MLLSLVRRSLHAKVIPGLLPEKTASRLFSELPAALTSRDTLDWGGLTSELEAKCRETPGDASLANGHNLSFFLSGLSAAPEQPSRALALALSKSTEQPQQLPMARGRLLDAVACVHAAYIARRVNSLAAGVRGPGYVYLMYRKDGHTDYAFLEKGRAEDGLGIDDGGMGAAAKLALKEKERERAEAGSGSSGPGSASGPGTGPGGRALTLSEQAAEAAKGAGGAGKQSWLAFLNQASDKAVPGKETGEFRGAHGSGAESALVPGQTDRRRRSGAELLVNLMESSGAWDGEFQVRLFLEGESPATSDSWTPVLCVSLWESAYLEHFGLDRAAYLHALWPHVDWAVVQERIAKAKVLADEDEAVPTSAHERAREVDQLVADIGRYSSFSLPEIEQRVSAMLTKGADRGLSKNASAFVRAHKVKAISEVIFAHQNHSIALRKLGVLLDSIKQENEEAEVATEEEIARRALADVAPVYRTETILDRLIADGAKN
jgi:hypothetical protein